MTKPYEPNLATPVVREVQRGQKCTALYAHKVTL